MTIQTFTTDGLRTYDEMSRLANAYEAFGNRLLDITSVKSTKGTRNVLLFETLEPHEPGITDPVIFSDSLPGGADLISKGTLSIKGEDKDSYAYRIKK